MSDYNGPSRECYVEFTREWCGVPVGTVARATHYPELGSYHVQVNRGQSIGTHPTHEGLIREVAAPASSRDPRAGSMSHKGTPEHLR